VSGPADQSRGDAARAAGDPSALAWDDRGLLPVVAQDVTSGDVLMVAYADRVALERTLALGEAHFHSRSRGETWHKGATSGNVLDVVEVRYDCDADALLYRVRPRGPACHTGERSCFFTVVGAGRRDLTDPAAAPGIASVAGLLQRVVDERLRLRPPGSYVAALAERGAGYAGQKVIEEAGETVVAALEGSADDLLAEAADLLFHLSVLLSLRGLRLDDVAGVLAARHREGSTGAAGNGRPPAGGGAGGSDDAADR
jgi:phosphoribosyl-AMP cyclohydrolase / phosphoribosyl-ATP pyrophosphohydrolase